MTPEASDANAPGLRSAAAVLGDSEALYLLASLVSIAPTNLEDPVHGRWEKPHYLRAVDVITRTARAWGFSTRIYDPVGDPESHTEFRGIPRPSVIIDLDVGAKERVLILAHFDVVPVPTEQLARWSSPPHTLTQRPDGRLYGRGSNDDLGSGVVASLMAMRRLIRGTTPHRNVRLLVCCDEETGGEGGVEALKEHDARLPPRDPARFIDGDVALIPDGSPHTVAGSCGVVFMDATFASPVSLSAVVAYGRALVQLHETVRSWKSTLPSPDWPDHGAPEPVITGRATVTKFDLDLTPGSGGELPTLRSCHAETDAANQIAEAVTMVFDGPPASLALLVDRLSAALPAPFRLSRDVRTSLAIPPGALALQLIGKSAHGGYPHRGHNPVPAALELLKIATEKSWVDRSGLSVASFAVDLRLTPEMTLEAGISEGLGTVRSWISANDTRARVDAPPGRCRGGYYLPPDDPKVLRLERLLSEEIGGSGVFGEYGGTDASSLASLSTPSGNPLAALVFGSMDREAHIHEAEESVDPKVLRQVSETIYRFIAEP